MSYEDVYMFFQMFYLGLFLRNPYEKKSSDKKSLFSKDLRKSRFVSGLAGEICGPFGSGNRLTLMEGFQYK